MSLLGAETYRHKDNSLQIFKHLKGLVGRIVGTDLLDVEKDGNNCDMHISNQICFVILQLWLEQDGSIAEINKASLLVLAGSTTCLKFSY